MTAPATGGGVTATATSTLCFRDVSKWYGTMAALLGVSFEVGAEVVGLVGRNGAGKSTLLRLAVGLLAPSQGEVEVCGVRATARTARALLGYCPDTERLYERLSGLEFVAWMLRYHGLPLARARQRAGEVLSQLGLGADMHRPVREYSRGMRQRVRLGQALGHGPRFVLLDEPMTGLDPVARAELAEHLRRLPEQGVGVLVSSHVLHELEAVVDRVVLLHQGTVLAHGRVAELRRSIRSRPHRVRVRAPALRELAAELVRWPDVLGLAVRDDHLELSIGASPGFYDRLTGLAAERVGGLDELVPLDDDLASVFGYLVE